MIHRCMQTDVGLVPIKKIRALKKIRKQTVLVANCERKYGQVSLDEYTEYQRIISLIDDLTPEVER